MKDANIRARMFRAALPLLCALLACACSTAASPRPTPEIHPGLPYADSAFAELGGARVHYRFSLPSGYPEDAIRGYVFLMHGLAGSTWSWNYLMPALNAAGYATLAVDIPPFGYSAGDASAFRDPFEASRLLWHLADSKHPGRWLIVAHSMGGQYAAAMAEAAPGRVVKAALFAPAIGGDQKAPAFARLPFAKPLLVSYLKSTVGNERRFAKLLAGAYGRRPDARELAGYAAPFALDGKIEALADWALSPRSAKPAPGGVVASFTDIPVLLIWGELDSWVPLKRGQALLAAIAGARLDVLAGEGHCSMETAPDAANELVLDFFGSD